MLLLIDYGSNHSPEPRVGSAIVPVVVRNFQKKLGRLPNLKNPTTFNEKDRLGNGLDLVRVDMYNINGRIVLGEFTNYPGAGLDRFDPLQFDELFGNKWRVPGRCE